MNKKKSLRAMIIALCGVLCLSSFPMMSGCNPTGSKKDSIVIMTEELSGLFNPFYATSGADQDVVGMTQIGMLSTDKDGKTVCGDDLPTVVKDYEVKEVTNNGQTETIYTFVIKNGLKFSDGEPLNMNDVLFNMYEYLDPVYTGSSTMYSIKIKGLTQYRTQKNYANGGSEAESQLALQASANARIRTLELVTLFETNGLIEGSTSSYSRTEAQMKEDIAKWDVSDGYKDAVASKSAQEKMTDEDYRKILLDDYNLTLKTFKKELESDYKAAKESYDLTTDPYKAHAAKLQNDIFKFFLYEGYITPVYKDVQGKKDRTVIEKFDGEQIVNNYKTEADAINRVYGDTIKEKLNAVLTQWGTAGELMTQYSATAREVILQNNMKADGSMEFPNIEGIVSLGHTTDVNTVTVNAKEYKVAHEHDAKGSPVNSGEYDVLQITIEGVDPKAIYNFGFTVAPSHYYSSDSAHPQGREIDIKNNKFGVDYVSYSFQSNTIQSHNEVPMGAGAYMATDSNNSNNPSGSAFVSSNIVYYKKNPHFMFEVKTEKLRMQVTTAANALDKLQNGELDYVTPQFTKANSDRINQMKDSGFKALAAWQLGYGYIGINAGKVKNVNIRRAIMSAMQTSLALEYYEAGQAKNIDWPMSTESWAYPFEADGKTSKPNGHTYTQWIPATGEEDAKTKIRKYMRDAGVSENSSDLKIKFTIAGASITEHPTYGVFKQAAKILNDCGWQVEVKADSQALTKLSTGSLEVWAAAWGSTIDPDMYQVYHKNSSATSVYAWGYREILSNTTLYSYENEIINKLSGLIDDARAITGIAERTALYEQAMGLVLDLAVEMPVYQRKTLYVYNTKTIKGLNEDVNPYSSPLEKVWELELVG